MCIKPGAWGEGSGNKLETPLPHTHKETNTACCYCDLHSPGHFLTAKEAPCGWLALEGVAGYSRLKWCPGPALIRVRKTTPHLSSAQRPSLWKIREQGGRKTQPTVPTPEGNREAVGWGPGPSECPSQQARMHTTLHRGDPLAAAQATLQATEQGFGRDDSRQFWRYLNSMA